MNETYKNIIENWISKIPAKVSLKFEFTKILEEVLPSYNGQGPRDLFSQETLNLLSWLYTVNQEIIKRREHLSKPGYKQILRQRGDEWLITGDPAALLDMFPVPDAGELARLKTILRELSTQIGSPIVAACNAVAYKAVLDELQPIVKELEEGERENAELYDSAFEPSPVLKKLTAIRSSLIGKLDLYTSGTSTSEWWAGAINQMLGRFVIEESDTDGWCPGSADEVFRIVSDCENTIKRISAEAKGISAFANQLGEA